MAFLRNFFFKQTKHTSGNISAKAEVTNSCTNTNEVGARQISDSQGKDASHGGDSMRHRIAVVEEFLDKVLNGRNVQLAFEYMNSDCDIVFADNHILTCQEFGDEVGRMFASLPDFSFSFSKVEGMENGTVVVRELIASGTHTGAPFGFGPCDPIPASGAKVVCDKEEIHFTFENGKISNLQVIAFGEMTGPQGIYTLLGGFPM